MNLSELKTNNLKLACFQKSFGLKKLLYSYYLTRAIEYPFAVNSMGLNQSMKVLDFGSGDSLLPMYLAAKGVNTFSVDLVDSQLATVQNDVLRSRYRSLVNKKMHYIFCNGKDLPCKNNLFDRVFSISVLEHIKEDGDIKIIQEFSRVLKPGGKIFISVEFHREFKEIIVPPKNKRKDGNKPKSCQWDNFVRYYNKKSLFERIINPSGLSLGKIMLFGSPKINIRKYSDTEGFFKYIRLLNPLLAKICYRKLANEEDLIRCATAKPRYLSNIIACIILSKNEVSCK